MSNDLVLNISKYIAIVSLLVTDFISSTFNVTLKDGNQLYVDTYPKVVLSTLWIEYRDRFIQSDGRTIDRNRDYITTSEGQSYSLLRAVWMDDKKTFDQVLKWTNNNLRQREEDKLFGWKWGQNPDGSWNILHDDGGINTASDADQDIALALIFASKRWNNENYLKQAQVILNDIWNTEVIEIEGRPYLLAGNWAKDEEYPTINPSYYNFAAYPIFAEVDTLHNWFLLRETSYEALDKASALPASDGEGKYLPPDWASLDPVTGEVLPPMHNDMTTNFSDDAIRVPWRVALDYKWHKNQQAYDYLSKISFFKDEWAKSGKLYSEYDRAGNRVTDYESASLYGAVIGYFAVQAPEQAYEIYNRKLISVYDRDTERLFNHEENRYYDQNWIWFGIALYQNALVNLYEVQGEDFYVK